MRGLIRLRLRVTAIRRSFGVTMKLKTLLMRLDLLSSSWAGVWPCVCGFFAIVYHLPFWRTSVMNQHLCEGSFKGNSRIHLYSSFFFSARHPHRRWLWRV